jgi:hypothetical protein
MKTANTQHIIYRRKLDETHEDSKAKMDRLFEGLEGISNNTVEISFKKILDDGIAFESELIAIVSGEDGSSINCSIADDALLQLFDVIGVKYLDKIMGQMVTAKDVQQSGLDDKALSIAQSRIMNAVLLFRSRYIDSSKVKLLIQNNTIKRVASMYTAGHIKAQIERHLGQPVENAYHHLIGYSYRNHEIMIDFVQAEPEFALNYAGRDIIPSLQYIGSEAALFDSTFKHEFRPCLYDCATRAVIHEPDASKIDGDKSLLIGVAAQNRIADMKQAIISFLTPKISKAKSVYVTSPEANLNGNPNLTLWDVVCAISNLGFMFETTKEYQVEKSSYPTISAQINYRKVAADVLSKFGTQLILAGALASIEQPEQEAEITEEQQARMVSEASDDEISEEQEIEEGNAQLDQLNSEANEAEEAEEVPVASDGEEINDAEEEPLF